MPRTKPRRGPTATQRLMARDEAAYQAQTQPVDKPAPTAAVTRRELHARPRGINRRTGLVLGGGALAGGLLLHDRRQRRQQVGKANLARQHRINAITGAATGAVGLGAMGALAFKKPKLAAKLAAVHAGTSGANNLTYARTQERLARRESAVHKSYLVPAHVISKSYPVKVPVPGSVGLTPRLPSGRWAGTAPRLEVTHHHSRTNRTSAALKITKHSVGTATAKAGGARVGRRISV